MGVADGVVAVGDACDNVVGVAEAVVDATAEVSIEVPVSAACLATARAPSHKTGLT